MASKLMLYKSRNKIDLFSFLMIFVAAGLSLTLAYQVHLFYGKSEQPVVGEFFAWPEVAR